MGDFLGLPPVAWAAIAARLDPPTVLSLGSVCVGLCRLMRSNAIWSAIIRSQNAGLPRELLQTVRPGPPPLCMHACSLVVYEHVVCSWPAS